MTKKYSREDVFKYYKTSSAYSRTIYTGELKPEYVGKFTEHEISDICDQYHFNFGSRTKLNENGTFICEIFIDWKESKWINAQ